MFIGPGHGWPGPRFMVSLVQKGNGASFSGERGAVECICSDCGLCEASSTGFIVDDDAFCAMAEGAVLRGYSEPLSQRRAERQVERQEDRNIGCRTRR